MKIVAISDMHGRCSESTLDAYKDIDILLIAGDTVDTYCQRRMEDSEQFYKNDFIPWLKNVDAKHIVMVGGNHDFFLEKKPDKFKELIEGTNITYLQNEYVDIDGITIYGTPLCHVFFNWAFMPGDDKQREVYKETMDGRKIDILLAHDAPYGCSDICFESSWGRDHIGSNVLRDIVLEKKPKYLIHGHLHSSNHDEEILGETRVYNVSLVNEAYKQAYKPLELEI